MPLPHEDQPHLHGYSALPDLASLIPTAAPNRDAGLQPGERGYFVGFDSLSTSGHAPSLGADNVLILGYEGGLTIHRVGPPANARVDRRKSEEIGRLEGLKGAVIGAKILPATWGQDSYRELRPLIAVVLHGPVFPPEEKRDNEAEADEGDGSGTEDGKQMSSTAGSAPDVHHVLKQYQTTVEVFSLFNQQHLATLYSCPPVDVSFNANGEPAIPEPQGDLRVEARGKFVIVASGTSGEVFIFSSYTRKPDVEIPNHCWRCVGKLWTSAISRSIPGTNQGSMSSNATELNLGTANEEDERIKSMPLLSVSHRYLALVPPSVSGAHITPKGIVLLPNELVKPPGLVNTIAPPAPANNCVLDSQNVSLVSRLSREATQGLLKGAQWIGERGMEAYNTYWARTSPPHTSPNQRPVSTGYGLTTEQQTVFPPTHAFSQNSARAAGDEQKQVAIYDLQRLLDAEENPKIKNAVTPVAAFELSSGVSYLSFAPSGMALLTVNRKGDENALWSLMKAVHSSASSSPLTIPTEDETSKCDTQVQPQSVRQIWKAERMSPARVVDVAWSEPRGDRVAILTDRGTVHVHDLPSAVLHWPLSRRRTTRQHLAVQDPIGEENGAIGASALGSKRWSSALETINGAVKSVRDGSRSLSIGGGPFAGINMATPAATAKGGGKMVRRGLEKGYDVLASNAEGLWNREDSMLRLQNPPDGFVNPGIIRLIQGTNGSGVGKGERARSSLAVVEGAAVKIHPIRQVASSRRSKHGMDRVKVSKRCREFALPSIPDHVYPPSFIDAVERIFGSRNPGPSGPADNHEDGGSDQHHDNVNPNLKSGVGITGHWALRSSRPNAARQEAERENWHAIMEAESNPPYQPFHFDRRFALYAYVELSSSRTADPSSPHPPPSALHNEASGYRSIENNHLNADGGGVELEADSENDDDDGEDDWSRHELEAFEWETHLKHTHHVDDENKWLYGDIAADDVESRLLSLGPPQSASFGGSTGPEREDVHGVYLENRISIVEGEEGEQVVVMTVSRDERDGDEGVFEDECEVVGFAE